MTEPITPTPEQTGLLAGLAADQPVVMINLLRFKRDGGEVHYQRYAREVLPHMEAVGARAVYAGSAQATLIGSEPRPWWDAILVVYYPTPAAFQKMVSSEAYLEVHAHREAALERAELIATSAWGLGA